MRQLPGLQRFFFVITCPCFDEALLPADNCETFLLEILSV